MPCHHVKPPNINLENKKPVIVYVSSSVSAFETSDMIIGRPRVQECEGSAPLLDPAALGAVDSTSLVAGDRVQVGWDKGWYSGRVKECVASLDWQNRPR